MTTNHRPDRVAGACAILSVLSWLTWAVINSVTRGGLEAAPAAGGSRFAKLGPLLTAAWNLLLIPAAMSLRRQLGGASDGLVSIYTVAGVVSLCFWAFGGVTRITPTLEITYLALSAVWWLGIGRELWTHRRRALGAFTMIVGGFAALDMLLCVAEPVPFAVFVLAAPKLPLAAAWSITIGVTLWRGARAEFEMG
jgi:hypothetical protein